MYLPWACLRNLKPTSVQQPGVLEEQKSLAGTLRKNEGGVEQRIDSILQEQQEFYTES